MATALRAAEEGGIFFPNPQGGGYFQNFSFYLTQSLPHYLKVRVRCITSIALSMSSLPFVSKRKSFVLSVNQNVNQSLDSKSNFFFHSSHS